MTPASPEIQRVTIRRAVAHDVVNIMRLLEQSVAENEVGYPEPDPLKLLAWVSECLAPGVILVADISGRIIGVLGLKMREWPWSKAEFVASEFFFVLPQFRARGTADALLSAAAVFADRGKLRLVVSFSSGKDARAKDRMTQMKGFTYAGGNLHRLPKE